mgnify:CR=1 FL=1
MDNIIMTIILGSIAFRGSSKLAIAEIYDKPLWASYSLGIQIINYYTLFALPIAAFNGFFFAGYRGAIVAFIGTLFMKFIVDQISNSIPYTLYIFQFIIFAPINIIFTINNWFYY